MKTTKLIVAAIIASSGFVTAANVVYSGTALANVQGTTAADVTAGKLGLIVADTTGNGFGAYSTLIDSASAGLLAGGTFGGDLILGRVSSAFLSDATMGGGFTWNATVAPVNTQWAVVWFSTLLSSDAGTAFAPAGTAYGIARANNWTTPSAEPGAGTTLTYANSGNPARITLNAFGSVNPLPAGADFATNGATLSVIPEPSAALLGALGALGLLRRRRI
jgi:MYXO-CTERM domain-containing protein